MSSQHQRITSVEVWHLALPVTSRRDHGIGAVSGQCEIVVLCLTAEDGSQGWGEASCWSVFTGSPEASFAAIDRYFRPLLENRPLSDRAQIMADAQRVVAHCTEAKAALETALLDLAGRVAGLSVHALLGGAAQTRIPLSVSLANPDFDADLHLMESLRRDGIRMVKLKTGFAGHKFDMMRMERLRRDYPEFHLRVDYNQGLRIEEASKAVRDIAQFKPDFIEQPVAAAQYDVMARLRESIDVPLLADESVFGPEDMVRALREGICDGVSIKIMKAGGLSRAQEVARMARHHGLLAYGGDMFESGLAHLAGAHMIAATPEIGLGCEFYQAKYYLVEDILGAPFPIEKGHVVVPDTPGLGIAPDRDRLDATAERKAAA